MVNPERWDGVENSEKANAAKRGEIEIKLLNDFDNKPAGYLDITGIVPYSDITEFLKLNGANKNLLDTVVQIREDIRRFTLKGVSIDTDGNTGEAAKASTKYKHEITPQDFSNLTYEIKGSSGKSIVFYTNGKTATGFIHAFDAYAAKLLDKQTMPGYSVRAHTLVKQILVEIAEEQKEAKLEGAEKK